MPIRKQQIGISNLRIRKSWTRQINLSKSFNSLTELKKN